MDNIRYTVLRFNKEILFLPNIVDYGSTYNEADIIAFDIDNAKFVELLELRNATPQDKIFDLDIKLNPIYHDKYTEEEKIQKAFKEAISYYQIELVKANKFFQEYNFGLVGTEQDMKDVREYLKNIRLTEDDYDKFNPDMKYIRPEILNNY